MRSVERHGAVNHTIGKVRCVVEDEIGFGEPLLRMPMRLAAHNASPRCPDLNRSVATLVIGGLRAGFSARRLNDTFAVLRYRLTAPRGFGGRRPILVLLRRPGVASPLVVAAGRLSIVANGPTACRLRAFGECGRRENHQRHRANRSPQHVMHSKNIGDERETYEVSAEGSIGCIT